ncbi:MAG: thiamine phosphate synthase [Pseudomonadota bacterium]
MTSPIRGLYAITDPQWLPGTRLPDGVRAALDGGARIVQYRNKAADAATRLREATQLATLCRDRGALFLANDDIELALACNAHGVHLGQQDGAVAAARARLGDGAIVGQTCHSSLELALAAEQAGASYVAFGRFFPSHTKPLAPPAPLALLPEARQRLRIPIVAIGGVTVDNAPSLIAAGADAVAVIHDLFSVHDIAGRAQRFAALFAPRPQS